ncbi:MAG: glycosyltransferase family 4 protein [Proteobacteria bacterium]|nr:glycosyltransferase family 4 protein [Pseudomonadota bacterium]
MDRACTFLVPGDWNSLTGGYIYDRQIVTGLRARGWRVTVASPGDGFPWPDAAALQHAREVVDALPDGALVVADGLAFGVLPEMARAQARRLRWVALVHHPLALESGLTAAQQTQLRASEREALAQARRVVVTSPSTARALSDYGVSPEHVDVVMPGTARMPVSTGGGAGADALALLCVATVTSRKGHAVLVDALAALRDRAWHLHCVGSLTRDPAAVAAAQAAADRQGLHGRITWHGEFDAARLAACYAEADLFVLPSFHEGYGMALAEALACGLPVISCAAGAIVDTVPADAGVLVPPGDAAALGAALARAIDMPGWRAQLAAGARRAARTLPCWSDATERFEAALLQALQAPPP